MLHLTKLAVGVRDVAHLAHIQSRRQQIEPPLRHRTRSFPRRAAELIDGGSIYWVVGGATLARQRILDIRPDVWDDGRACAALRLDPALVVVLARPTRPFQGWRYLAAEAAPADIAALATAAGADAMPAELRQALQSLGLL